MSHHSEIPDGLNAEVLKLLRNKDDLKNEVLKEMERQPSPLGPTGQFPEGKLTEHDEGEIAFAVGSQHGKVIVDFGKPIASVGMNPQQAIAFANSLITHAKRSRIIGDKTPNSRHKGTA